MVETREQMKSRPTKMSSLGNTFIVINNIDGLQKTGDILNNILDNCDQVLVIERSERATADFRMRAFNLDGTEAGQCGNGVRCVAKYAREKGLVDKDIIHIEASLKILVGAPDVSKYLNSLSPPRIAQATLLANGDVRATLGQPEFTPSKVPFNVQVQADDYSIELDNLSPQIEELFHNALKKVGVVSMENPHAVMQTDKVDRYSEAEFSELGTAFQNQELKFPLQVNVGLMQVQARDSIHLRVFERGVGETLACGSGACAAVAVGRKWGILNDKVQVHMPGGMLTIEHDEQDGLAMTGPVKFSW